MAKVSAMAQGRILVVDDHAQERELLTELLEQHGYSVQTAADGEEAWSLLNTEPGYDLVITDLNMPVMDGLQLLERIQEYSLPARLILRTGFATYGMALKARNLRAFAVLSEPYDLEEFVQTVELALMRRAVAGKEVANDGKADRSTDRCPDGTLDRESALSSGQSGR